MALETAHLRLSRAYQPRLIPLSDLYSGNNLDRTAAALGLDLNDFSWWRDLLDWNLWFPASRQAFNEIARGERKITDVIGATVNQVVTMLQVIEMLPDIGVEDIAPDLRGVPASRRRGILRGRTPAGLVHGLYARPASGWYLPEA